MAQVVDLVKRTALDEKYDALLEATLERVEQAGDSLLDDLVNLAMLGPWREWNEEQQMDAVERIGTDALGETNDPRIRALAGLLAHTGEVLHDVPSHLAMARHLAHAGKTAEAMRGLDAVTPLEPSSRDAWMQKAGLARSLGQDDVAAECEAQAVALATAQVAGSPSAGHGLRRSCSTPEPSGLWRVSRRGRLPERWACRTVPCGASRQGALPTRRNSRSQARAASQRVRPVRDRCSSAAEAVLLAASPDREWVSKDVRPSRPTEKSESPRDPTADVLAAAYRILGARAFRYSRSFTWRCDPSAGFSFDCDENGNVFFEAEAGPLAWANLKRCLDGTYDVIDDGVVVRRLHPEEPLS